MGPLVRRCVVLGCVSAVLLSISIGRVGVRVEAGTVASVEGKRSLERQDVYLPSVMQWEGAVGAAAGTKSHVEIAVFYPWGEFVGARLMVNRLENGSLEAQTQADYALRRGTWTRKGRLVTVESKWVKFEAADPGKHKSKDFKETWTTDPKNEKELSRFLMIGGSEYVQAQALSNPVDLETLFNRPLEDPKKAKKKAKK